MNGIKNLLPHGAQGKIAERLKISRTTVVFCLEKDSRYSEQTIKDVWAEAIKIIGEDVRQKLESKKKMEYELSKL